MTQDFFGDHLGDAPVLVILRGHSPADTVRLCVEAAALGVRLVEVPLGRAESRDALLAAVEWATGRDDVVIGAGTVTTRDRLDEAQEAGARFVVSPGLHRDVVLGCAERGLPHLPGVATASDVAAALDEYSLRWQKAFPAGVLGAAWFRAMAGPFPDVSFVATGGVNATNLHQLLDAGCAAISLGEGFSASHDAISGLLGQRQGPGRNGTPL